MCCMTAVLWKRCAKERTKRRKCGGGGCHIFTEHVPDKAEEWLRKMEKAGVPANVVSYSTVIDARQHADQNPLSERQVCTSCHTAPGSVYKAQYKTYKTTNNHVHVYSHKARRAANYAVLARLAARPIRQFAWYRPALSRWARSQKRNHYRGRDWLTPPIETLGTNGILSNGPCLALVSLCFVHSFLAQAALVCGVNPDPVLLDGEAQPEFMSLPLSM